MDQQARHAQQAWTSRRATHRAVSRQESVILKGGSYDSGVTGAHQCRTVERCADLDAIDVEAEVELTHVPVRVAERVRVFLKQQILDGAGLAHKAEKVEVASEKDVQPHLNVVAGAVDERRHLQAHGCLMRSLRGVQTAVKDRGRRIPKERRLKCHTA